MKTFAHTLLVSVVLLLAACDSTYQGKTAQEWKEIADNYKGMAGKPAIASPKEIVEAVKGKPEPTEAELAEKQEMTNASFRAATLDQTTMITASKDGRVIVEAAESGTRNLNRLQGDEIVLGGAAWMFFDDTMKKLLPNNAFDGNYERVRANGDTVQDSEGKIRAAVISWFVRDPKRLEMVWNTFRPTLRQKYDLLKTLRGYEPLFKTAYTHKGFAPLAECLTWHEEFIADSGDVKKTFSEADRKRCNGLIKTFGVKGTAFGSQESDALSARNALWIVRFLARRAADGDEKFAQQFQRLALDYIK